MAPVALPQVVSGERARQISRSISSHLTPNERSSSLATRALNVLTRITHPTLRQPTSPTPLSSSSILLSKRQTQVLAIPTTYQGLNAGPPPGTVVGIVLGSVAGFLLLLWLIYTCVSMGRNRFSGAREVNTTVIEEEVIHRRERSPRRSVRSARSARSAHSVSRSRSRSETIEVASVHRSPIRRPSRRERVVVESVRRTTRPAPPPPEDDIVEVIEEHSPVDDIVEVIEEHSPVRRPSRKESRRTSGFRTVDPAEYAGGDRPMRKVSRR